MLLLMAGLQTGSEAVRKSQENLKIMYIIIHCEVRKILY